MKQACPRRYEAFDPPEVLALLCSTAERNSKKANKNYRLLKADPNLYNSSGSDARISYGPFVSVLVFERLDSISLKEFYGFG